MSLIALKRKTGTAYSKRHSHGHNGETGFSINGSHRTLGYIGKDKKNSNVITPFKGALPMGFDGKALSSYIVYKHVDGKASQSKFVNPSVVHSRERMNHYMWCCKDIVRSQSGIDMGSQDLYISKKSAANDCMKRANKPPPSVNISSNRLDCANNYTKEATPVDSSLRTLAVQKQCALTVMHPSKLFITTGTSNVKHGGC